MEMLNAGQLESFVEFLQIIDQEMRPRPIHGLLLTNDSLFKVKASLSPAENLRDGGFPIERTKYRVADGSLL